MRNSAAKPSGDPRCDLTGCFNVRQVKALRVPNPAALVTNVKAVFAHDPHLSHECCAYNPILGITSEKHQTERAVSLA